HPGCSARLRRAGGAIMGDSRCEGRAARRGGREDAASRRPAALRTCSSEMRSSTACWPCRGGRWPRRAQSSPWPAKPGAGRRAGRVEGLPCLLALAVRAVHGAPRADVGTLLATPSVESLELAALSEVAVARVVSHALGAVVDADFGAACRRATRGNPFLVVSL